MSQGPLLTAYYDDTGDLWVTFMTAMADMAAPPFVISISYGVSETAIATDSSTWSLVAQFDLEAMKASLQGTTNASRSQLSQQLDEMGIEHDIGGLMVFAQETE
jgi:hypothetical protein